MFGSGSVGRIITNLKGSSGGYHDKIIFVCNFIAYEKILENRYVY